MKSDIDEVNEIEQNLMKCFFRFCLLPCQLVNISFILFKTLTTFYRILSTTTKVSVNFHLEFVINGWWAGLMWKCLARKY
jgi:hypothetical protein